MSDIWEKLSMSREVFWVVEKEVNLKSDLGKMS